jgi:hypothetical protein
MTETSRMLDRGKEFMDELTLKLSLSFQIYREDVRKLWFLSGGPLLKMSLKSKIMGIVLSK